MQAELVAKYAKVTDEVVAAAMESLVNFGMKHDHNEPDGVFMERNLAHSGPATMREPISYRIVV